MRKMGSIFMVGMLTSGMVVASLHPAIAQSDGSEMTPGGDTAALEWGQLAKPKGLGKGVTATSIASLDDGTLYVVGRDRKRPATWTSTDGLEWSKTRLPGARAAAARDVVAWQGGLVVTGVQSVDDGFDSFVWTSPDGVDWSKPVKLEHASVGDIDVTPEGLALTGWTAKGLGEPSTPTVWVSGDGQAWEPIALGDEGASAGFMGVSPEGIRVVQGWETDPDVGVTARMWRSEDGRAWSPVDLPPETQGARGWRGTTDFACEAFGFVQGVNGSGDDSLIGVGSVWHSSDGLTWQQVASPTAAVSLVVTGPAGCLAITRPSLDSSDDTEIAFDDTPPFVLTSTDGTDWATLEEASLDGSGVWSAASRDGDIVALGSKQPGFSALRFWVGQGPAAADGGESSTARPLPRVVDVVPTLGFLGDLVVVHSRPATVVVSPDGGSMALDDGSTVEVPRASFSEPTELTVVIVDVLFEKYLDDAPEATIYALSTPEATTLAAPVVLSVPVPADEVVVEALVNGEWQEVDVPSGPTTRIEFDHFSTQIRSIVPRGDFPFMSAVEMERDDRERADRFARQGWCLELAVVLVASDEFEEAGRQSIAALYMAAVCSKWPIADEDCLTQQIDDVRSTFEKVRRCVEPPAEGPPPDEPTNELADDAGSDVDGDDSASTTVTATARPEPDQPSESSEPHDPEFVSQATMSESARVFKGNGTISYTVRSIDNVLGVVEGCTVDLEVETQVALQLDGNVTLAFADWPLRSGHTEGNPISRQWVECFAPAGRESWGDGKTGPNLRIYSTPWIGVGDTIFWSEIEIGQIGSIRVDVSDTQPTASAEGHATLSVDLEVLTNSGSEVIKDHQAYVIDFALDEV